MDVPDLVHCFSGPQLFTEATIDGLDYELVNRLNYIVFQLTLTSDFT